MNKLYQHYYQILQRSAEYRTYSSSYAVDGEGESIADFKLFFNEK